RGTMAGAGDADGKQPPRGDGLAQGRYFAGGCRSLRGVAFRAVPAKTGRAESGCGEPDAPDCVSKDIRVGGQAQRTGSLLFGVGTNADAGLVGSIALNERNFDIRRPRLNSGGCPRPTQANDPLPVVTFLDAGTVGRCVSPHDYRVSVGAGLRITVPTLG